MLYYFGDYTLDAEHYELRQAGTLVRVEPRAFDLLTYLVQHTGRTVTKEELLEQLWPKQFVSESALTYCIAGVRKAIGDSGRAQRCIKTVHGRGYCFITPVTVRQYTEPALSGPAGVDIPEADVEPELDDADPAPGVIPVPPDPVPTLLTQSLPPSETPLTAVPGPLEAERRQLTVLVCRLVEAAESPVPLDPEELFEVVQDYQAMCTEVIRRYDGHIAHYQGAGLVVHFGYPRAHEDDARRAVHTGLGIVEGMVALNRHLKREQAVQLAVRVGIHTGVVVVSATGRGDTREPLTLGNTPTIAAQLPSLAMSNTVVISPATWQLVEGYFETQAFGAHILEEPAEPLALYQVLHVSPRRSRFEVAVTKGLTPLVGRVQEVELLRERWVQTTDGMGQVVWLSGEAGIGKTRLVQVLKEHLAGETHTCIECRCSPYYQQSAFYPLVDHLQRLLQFRREDSVHDKIRKLEATLGRYRIALEEGVPLFAALMSLPPPAHYPALTLTPQKQKQQTLAAMLAWLLQEAEQQPVCVIMEDLHWADPSTLEFLGLLLDQVPITRILVLLLSRPEFRMPWTVRSHFTQLTLSRLPRRQAEAMIDRLTGGKPLPVELIEQLIATTDGVPLFIEEVTKMVLESGWLKETQGQYALRGPLPPLAIPVTLHDSLMARLDRLASAKYVIQLGAIFGREFTYTLLQAVTAMDDATLQEELTRLVDAELLYQRGIVPQAHYIFKHSLIQEVAYHSLLKRTRQQYHEQIAEVLEERFPEVPETQPELLAQHYTEAGQSVRAIPYWRRAAQQAMGRSGYREAVACLEQALVALQQLPEDHHTLEQMIDIRLALRTPLQALGAFERIYEHLQAADALAQTLADAGRQGWIAAYLSAHCFNSGALEQALENGRQALAFAQSCGDAALKTVGTYFVGLAALSRGRYAEAITMLGDRLDELTQGRSDESFGLPGPAAILARAWVTWGLAEQGAFAEGLRRGTAGLRLAEAAPHPFALASVAEGLGVVYLRQGAMSQAIAMFERGLQLCREWRLPLRVSSLTAFLGYTYALTGRTADALLLLEEAVAQAAVMQRQVYQALWMAFLSETQLQADRWEVAAQLAEQALALARTQQEAGTEAWVLRLCGDIAARRVPFAPAPAEAWYRQALHLADELRMRPLQAHCHLGLGLLYHQHGAQPRAQSELVHARELLRSLEMTFWLPRVETVLGTLGGTEDISSRQWTDTQ